MKTTAAARRLTALATRLGLDVEVTEAEFPTAGGSSRGFVAWGQNIGFTVAQAERELRETAEARKAQD